MRAHSNVARSIRTPLPFFADSPPILNRQNDVGLGFARFERELLACSLGRLGGVEPEGGDLDELLAGADKVGSEPGRRPPSPGRWGHRQRLSFSRPGSGQRLAGFSTVGHRRTDHVGVTRPPTPGRLAQPEHHGPALAGFRRRTVTVTPLAPGSAPDRLCRSCRPGCSSTFAASRKRRIQQCPVLSVSTPTQLPPRPRGSMPVKAGATVAPATSSPAEGRAPRRSSPPARA